MSAIAKTMVVAGVMSGTSADGVDVALCRIGPSRVQAEPAVKVLGHRSFAYPKAVRAAVMAAMEGAALPVAEMSRLHWRLGQVYAECVANACAEIGAKAALVGVHGQTVYHQALAEKYLGAVVRATWQIGEASVVAERLRVPVVSDFRPADLAAGGQGAPLVPMLEYCLFRSKTKNRVLLNLGGIANLTSIPAGCGIDDLLAFDTGPANMVIDALMGRLFGRKFDDGGKTAGRGKGNAAVVSGLLADPYFKASAPKSCGREQFGEAYTARLLQTCEGAGLSKADTIATATLLTCRTIEKAYAEFVWPHLGRLAPLARGTELIVAGGGVRNAGLMAGLRESLTPLGVKVKTTNELGVAAQAKESVAFALLAWLSFHGLPGNVPAGTGAGREVVLGKVTHG